MLNALLNKMRSPEFRPITGLKHLFVSGFFIVFFLNSNVVFTQTYTQSTTTYSWDAVAGTAVTGTSCDDCRYAIPLPFNFTFFGTVYTAGTNVDVSTNGWLSFTTPQASSYWTNACLPNAAAPMNLVAAYWDDIAFYSGCGSASWKYQTIGTTPNRRFVITWNNFVSSSDYTWYCTNYVSTEIKLFETSNIIEVHVKESNLYPSTTSGTIGIQNATGSAPAYQAVCNSNPGSLSAWRWTPTVTNTITTSTTIAGSPFCDGGAVSVPFTSTGTFTGNTYTAQLSNSAGSFASPTSIGTLVSNANSGTISATIPGGTAAGAGYRIRVVSSSPVVTGTDNTVNLTVNNVPTVAAIGGGAASVCVSTTTPAFTDATAGGTWSITNGTGTASITAGGVVTGLTAGSVTVNYAVTNGCGTTTVTKALTVNNPPAVAAITGGATNVCGSPSGSTPAFTDATAGGTWSITNGTGAASITAGGVATGTAAGSVTVNYAVTTGGCTTTVTTPLTVDATPVVPAIGGGAASVCIGGTTPAFTNATGGGTWSITNGPGTATINSSGVATGVALGAVVVNYAVTNICGTVTRTYSPLTVTAAVAVNGGPDQYLCSGTVSATMAATGSGTWTKVSGAACTITTPGATNTTITGLASGTYVFRWTTGCGYDDVVVVIK